MVDGVWTPLQKAAPDPMSAVAADEAEYEKNRMRMLMRDPTYSEDDIRKVIGVRPGISPEAAMYANQAAQAGSAYNPNNPAVGGRGMQRGSPTAQPVVAPAAPPVPGARRMSAAGALGWEINGMFYTDEEIAAQAAWSK